MDGHVYLRAKEGKRESFAAVTPELLVSSLENTLGAGWEVSGTSRRKNTQAARAYGREGYQTRITARSREEVDGLRPEIRVYDQDYAGACLRVELGFFRLVCSNGLTAYVREATPLVISHRLSSTEALRALPGKVEQAYDRLKAALETVQLAKDTKVNADLVIDQFELPETLRERLRRTRPRREDDISTAWGLYNFINEVDRRSARVGSVAYLERDREMLANILEAAAGRGLYV